MNMKSRSIFLVLFLVFFLGGIFASSTHAVTQTQFWPKMCASCHDGNTALSKEAMREKYQTVSAFSEAVLNKGDRCMNILKNDKKMIKKVATEIGLK
jgi:nitrate/TMAO reductase-like tetraheme cytochrome c subunit